MADRTVRAIFEARVTGAQKGMRDLSTDVDKTGKKVEGLDKDLTALDKKKVKPTIDVAIDDAQKRIRDLTIDLGTLRTMEVTPVVTADIKDTQKKLREARAELRDLNGAKAAMTVTADTGQAKRELAGLADDAGDAGEDAGEDAGGGIVSGILDALRSIPIAGAVIGVGVAIGAGLLAGIQDGLSVEAGRDLFSAQTGLDEETSARFGRAAGEAYANAWGESVEANLDTARLALRAGIIDVSATDAEIENVIAKLSGISDLFQVDIAESVRAVGNLMKTGMVKNANEAFDLLVIGSQKVETQAGDIVDVYAESAATLKQFGLDAKTALGLFKQAIDAGAPSASFFTSALEELAGNAGDSIDVFKSLGLNGQDMARKLTGGGEQAAVGLDMLLDALRNVEDPAVRTTALVSLFGEEATAMQEALLAIDPTTAVAGLDELGDAAGGADAALATMSDNTATKIETAKRNIELAMDGIKGALAETFGDDIGNAADWVARNRAPLMQFFLDVINGTIDMAQGFLNFAADSSDALADVIEGVAALLDLMPGDQSEGKNRAFNIAAGLREGADEIRNNAIPALDEMSDKANTWAAPEILKARIHDATFAMTEDLKGFIAAVGEGDLEVTINGDTVNAEEALATLVENINGEDGTVLINGDKVPAEDALETLLEYIALGEEDVSIGGDTDPAKGDLHTLEGIVSAAEASMTVNADTAAAQKEIDRLARTRYVTIVAVNSRRVAPGYGDAGQHEGGWINKGLYNGGFVPGRDPGYDNVLWPLNSGGRTMVQPLAGGEYVVNSKDAAFYAPLLEWMNNGGRPTSHTVTNDSRLVADTVNIVTPSAESFKREFRTTAYRAKARPGR